MSETTTKKIIRFSAMFISGAVFLAIASGELKWAEPVAKVPDYRIVQYVNPDGKVDRFTGYHAYTEEHVPVLCTDVLDSTGKVDYHWEDELAPMTDSIQQTRIAQARDLVTKLRRFQQFPKTTQ